MAGGVLIEWTLWSEPFDHDLSEQPGTPTTLDGHAALINAAPANDFCGSIGASRRVHAIIVFGAASKYQTWLDMFACIAEPDTALTEQRIDAMLRSLRFVATPGP